eukprot:scaffold117582_cov25-Prasinocladus_malaysianus.AAC.1
MMYSRLDAQLNTGVDANDASGDALSDGACSDLEDDSLLVCVSLQYPTPWIVMIDIADIVAHNVQMDV